MFSLFRTLVLLALGLWLGAMVYFSFFAAVPILGQLPKLLTEERSWLRRELVPSAAVVGEEERRQAEALRQVQGRRLAGEALDVLFGTYFPFQAACASAAVVGGLALLPSGGRRARAALLFTGLAAAGVVLNILWLARQVKRLRLDRYSPDPEIRQAADAAFSTWHNVSLGIDMAGLACVLCAFLIAANIGQKPAAGA